MKKRLHPITLLNPGKAMEMAKKLPREAFQTLLVLAACCQNDYNISTWPIYRLANLLSNAKVRKNRMAMVKAKLEVLRSKNAIKDIVVDTGKGQLEGFEVSMIYEVEDNTESVIQVKAGRGTRELFAQLGPACAGIIALAIHADSYNRIATGGRPLKKLIADELGVSERTAQKYITALQQRYHVMSSKGRPYHIEPLRRLRNSGRWRLSTFVCQTARRENQKQQEGNP